MSRLHLVYIWYILPEHKNHELNTKSMLTTFLVLSVKSTLTNWLVLPVVSVLNSEHIWCNLFVKIVQLFKTVLPYQKKTQECPVVLWKNIFYAENNLLVYLTAQTRLHCTCVFSSGCWKRTVSNGCYRHVLIRERQRKNQTKVSPSTLLSSVTGLVMRILHVHKVDQNVQN